VPGLWWTKSSVVDWRGSGSSCPPTVPLTADSPSPTVRRRRASRSRLGRRLSAFTESAFCTPWRRSPIPLCTLERITDCVLQAVQVHEGWLRCFRPRAGVVNQNWVCFFSFRRRRSSLAVALTFICLSMTHGTVE
jgi:hypothetical protein